MDAAAPTGSTSLFDDWHAVVAAAKARQPDWSSPIVTTTAMLENRFRFDTQYQAAGNATRTVMLDGGKGLDVIVTPTTELQLATDPYYIRTSNLQTRQSDSRKDELSGFADWPFFRIKERLASSPESADDYVVSAWLQLQNASGIAPLTSHAFTLLPTLGFGKGWGPVDVQGSVGAVIPTAHETKIGTQFTSNAVVQYHWGRVFWPELEANLTYWADGPRGGKAQLYLTPGIVLGRFALSPDLRFTTGIGYQVAIAPHYQSSPLLPSYNHAWILTMRVSF